MTAQIPDSVELDGKPLPLVGVDGRGLFEPARHGLQPLLTSTANQRGYVCEYEVRGRPPGRRRAGPRTLHLRRLDVRLRVGWQHEVPLAPVVLGRRPTSFTPVGQADRQRQADLVYTDLGRVPFTGALLLGDGLLLELAVHMGFPAPWKFRRVVELLVEGGELVDVLDRSAELAELRARRRAEPRRRPGWIAESFRLDYDRRRLFGGVRPS